MVRIEVEHGGKTFGLEVKEPLSISAGQVEDIFIGLAFPELFAFRMKVAQAAIKALAGER